MTERELISLVAKAEGKRHQARVGDVREIWKILKELNWSHPDVTRLLNTKPRGKK
jgi:hypothetical protein